MSELTSSRPLCWVHFGDLHITEPSLENHRDFQAIIADVNAGLTDGVDFAVLPGDNADDGTAEQLTLVREGLDRLSLPHHVLTGDHDFKPKTLAAFYDVLEVRQLPYATTVSGYRCLFLDIVSPGTGGPDFRLGEAQLQWLRAQLEAARSNGRRAVVFMHAYPSDLTEETEVVAALFAEHEVLFVDTGHTHYNELANDGVTVFAATRSTGQIEEGPAGYAITSIDQGAVSWRFKLLETAWPMAMITTPADRRLSTLNRAAVGPTIVRALAWGPSPIVRAECSIDAGGWRPMTFGGGALWSADLDLPSEARTLTVRITDAAGGSDEDTISIDIPDNCGPGLGHQGGDVHSVGAWPERHILGTQLGPNRNGRKW